MSATALLATASDPGAAWVFWICGGLAVLGALGMIFPARRSTARFGWR